jgi:F-type H+-transporting ATPase subunit epsilon
MNSTLSVKIILPSMTLLDVEANMVNLPGQEGVFGVLPGHCKLISNINTGIVSVFLAGQEEKYFVFSGVAQVKGEELNILSEFALLVDRETKEEALDQVTLLKNSLLEQQPESLQANIILNTLEKYQALLKFL